MAAPAFNPVPFVIAASQPHRACDAACGYFGLGLLSLMLALLIMCWWVATRGL